MGSLNKGGCVYFNHVGTAPTTAPTKGPTTAPTNAPTVAPTKAPTKARLFDDTG